MNPVDRIQTVWIRPDPDFAGSSYFRIRPDPDPDPDPVHLYSLLGLHCGRRELWGRRGFDISHSYGVQTFKCSVRVQPQILIFKVCLCTRNCMQSGIRRPSAAKVFTTMTSSRHTAFESCPHFACDDVSDTRKFDRGLSQIMHTELHWLDVSERINYKLGMLMYRCQHNKAPRYLMAHCTSVSDVAYRQWLRSASQGCKRDVWCRDGDETETSESRDETETSEWRDRDETETLEWWSRDVTFKTTSRDVRSRRSSRDWSLGPIQLQLCNV